MMALRELVSGLPIVGEVPDELMIAGVEHDSRRVGTGDLFVAVRGSTHDGRRFASEAVGAGAVAVVAEAPPPNESGRDGPGVPWLLTDDARALLGPLSARVSDHPDRQLITVGVTGTNGKSTTVWLVREILDAAGIPAGRIGTQGAGFGDRWRQTERTTPEAPELYDLLASMREDGAEAAVMEVSSHALAQGRVDAMRFDVAVFTNLSRDHLDFHGDLDGYFAAKRSLFDRLEPGGGAVVNVDDEHGRRLARQLSDVVTVGVDGDVSARETELGIDGIRLTVTTPRGRLRVDSRLRGRYNVDNILAAIAVGEALSLPHEAVVEAISRLEPVPGRLERIEVGQPFPVFVDFAHTPAALRAAIDSVREITDRELVVVFGCGGDRDVGKREPMGRIAGAGAELPIITSDNPRHEDPVAIVADVEAGVRATGNDRYRVIPDRREAIRKAVAVAGPERTLLVAGKGDETYQIVGDERIPFSDREEIVEALREAGLAEEERGGGANRG